MYSGRMNTSEQLLSDIETHLTRFDLTATEFGVVVLKRPNFLFDLRRGMNVTLDTHDRVRRFMDDAVNERLRSA